MDEQGGTLLDCKTGGPWLLGSDTSNEMKCAFVFLKYFPSLNSL